MICLYSAHIWHLHHCVHLEVWQFEVSEHVLLFHLFNLLPFVFHDPWQYGNVILYQPFIYNVYVWNVPDVFHGVDFSLVPVV